MAESVEAVMCGCVPLPGGGVRSRCGEGSVLWHWYLMAIETDPGNRASWAGAWEAYAAHIGQEAWA